jgi:hypothetical protein
LAAATSATEVFGEKQILDSNGKIKDMNGINEAIEKYAQLSGKKEAEVRKEI